MAGRRGSLTILELFVLAVLIAAGAWVFVSRYNTSRDREHLATMKEDLRNLATAQEGYAADNAGAFMPRNSQVTTTIQYYGYAPSSGVTVDIAEPNVTGWSATATHDELPGRLCGIFVGDSVPPRPNPATTPGEPDCN